MTETETLAAETPAPLAEDELRLIDVYWHAANVLGLNPPVHPSWHLVAAAVAGF